MNTDGQNAAQNLAGNNGTVQNPIGNNGENNQGGLELTQILGLLQMNIAQLTNMQRNTQSKSKKPDRPEITASMDDREWAVFQDSWCRYKLMIGLSSDNRDDQQAIKMELRECCSSDVNKLLFEFVGRAVLQECTELQLLEHIKSVAVKTTHQEVHRMGFGLMAQQQGETITHYVSRLKSKAFLCNFDVVCGTCNPVGAAGIPIKISYAEEMVAQRLVAGLYNLDHQRKVLAEAATLTTLDAKVNRLRILETTEESATLLHSRPTNVPTESAAQSNYQREKKSTPGKKDQNGGKEQVTCRGCGRSSHPNGKSLDRSNCPAKLKKCFKCDLPGHIAIVCGGGRAKSRADHQTDKDERDDKNNPLPADASVSFSFGHSDFRLGQGMNEGI